LTINYVELGEKKQENSLTWDETLLYARHNFWYFYLTIFSISVETLEGRFEWGKHIREWADRMQTNTRTATLGPRKHLKSHTFYAYVMWRMYGIWYDAKIVKKRTMLYDMLYISYKMSMAGEHIENINRYVLINPYFGDWIKISDANSVMKYYFKGCEFNCKPEGMGSFKRGKHPHEVLCDDILADPTEKLEYSTMKKLNKIFFEQIASFPKEVVGRMHVIGTAQDSTDLFFQLKGNKKYSWNLYKAIIDRDRKEVLWPEFINYERLMEILEFELNGSEKIFNKEYQCSPVRSEDAYFTFDEVNEKMDKNLKDMWDMPEKVKGMCFGGFDVGKKRNPSHLSVFSAFGENIIQVHQKWMDGWGYGRQVEYLKMACDKFKIVRLYYDNTRAELESYAERGELPKAMKPIVFTSKVKYLMAAALEKVMGDERFRLLYNERQREMIICVDNDLNSPETGEGHGDSFWSNAMACISIVKRAKKGRVTT